MRPYKTLDDVFEQVEVLRRRRIRLQERLRPFPEYFNAPLMAKFNHLGSAEHPWLAQYTEEIRERFVNLAISYNINIITVACLC